MPNLTFFGCMLTAATSYAVHISGHGKGDELALAQEDWDTKSVG